MVTLEDDGEVCEFAVFETPLDKKGNKTTSPEQETI
jgi:hypothetical protein